MGFIALDISYNQASHSTPENLTQLLQKTASRYPDRGITYYKPGYLDRPAYDVSYPGLLADASAKAAKLYKLGLDAGTILLLHCKTQRENLEWFWAATYAGFVPAMSTPFSNNVEQRRAHILYLNDLFENPICLTSESMLEQFAVQDKMIVRTVEDISSAQSTWHVHASPPPSDGMFKKRTDTAALMLTSGSTGNAKAVALTHGMMLSSLEGKSRMNDTHSGTVFFNWIGADHVACLTEIHLHAMLLGADQVHAQPADIVQSPLSFLEIAVRHRVGYTFAPNFFLAAMLRALEDPSSWKLRRILNLVHLRCLISGGEANVVETTAALGKILTAFGAPKNCIKPAFGMTETCAGSIYNMSFPEHDVSRQHEFASLGACHPLMEMRIVDEDGSQLFDGATGALEVRGDVVFKDYYRNTEATRSSFHDGWFITGDQGRIDDAGQLNLTGRAKETLIINGVNYTPHEVEATLESISGARPSYSAVFPYRPKGSQTEGICVAYCPSYEPEDMQTRVSTNEAIAVAVMQQVGVRPLILPLNDKVLQKTTLGKLSRTKIRKCFEAGEYDNFRRFDEEQTAKYHEDAYEPPSTPLENTILEAFADVVGISASKVGVNADLYSFGVTSIDIIKIKKSLEASIHCTIPIITIISNPTGRRLAQALEDLQKPKEYSPVITLQPKGTKTPLWLVHPGVGEVLVFLSLASHITDRPVHALRARGFERGESYFSGIEEAVSTYHQHIKTVQPHGPYAIAGYSYGSMFAFEITKVLNAHGDEVKFLGAFNLPPHIKSRMRQLDWTNCLLHLSYFLDLLPEDEAHKMHPLLRLGPKQDALDYVLRVAPQQRMEDLGIDAASLANWADLAYALQSAAVDYEPSGMVKGIDVFAAIPLKEVANGVEDWKANHLSKWRDFTEEEPRIHEVEGAHYTMLSAQHVKSFQNILRGAMEERGL